MTDPRGKPGTAAPPPEGGARAPAESSSARTGAARPRSRPRAEASADESLETDPAALEPPSSATSEPREGWSEGPDQNLSAETNSVLEELNRLMLDLRHRENRSSLPPEPSAAVRSRPAPPPVEPPPAATAPTGKPAPVVEVPGATNRPSPSDRWGIPSPFLEERMGVALQAASGLAQEVDELERRSRGLRETIGTLEQELERANRELAWVRSVYGGAENSAEPPTADAPFAAGGRPPIRESGGPSSSAAVAPSAPVLRDPSPPFDRFTVSRYNRTVDGIKRRRPRVATITLLVSAAVSVALVTLTLLYGEPTPALWLAVLPVVWLIPVPFFVAAFWGTHRVLRRNHLSLPGGP